LEILKNYDRLFISHDPKIIAAGIHEILNRIRRNRPGLVEAEMQFEEAIRNAEILYQYALKKEYIKTAHKSTTLINRVFNEKTENHAKEEVAERDNLLTKASSALPHVSTTHSDAAGLFPLSKPQPPASTSKAKERPDKRCCVLM
jgi:hypothetical protein